MKPDLTAADIFQICEAFRREVDASAQRGQVSEVYAAGQLARRFREHPASADLLSVAALLESRLGSSDLVDKVTAAAQEAPGGGNHFEG